MPGAPPWRGECPCTHRRAPARGPENQKKRSPSIPLWGLLRRGQGSGRILNGWTLVASSCPSTPHARRITVACNDPTCHGPTAPVAMHWQASPGTAAIEHLSGPSKTAFPWRAESESELGIQRGIHLAFNGHSMGQIWHSGLFGSAEPYFSWTSANQFPGGNFLIILLEWGRSTGSRGRVLCTVPCLRGPPRPF